MTNHPQSAIGRLTIDFFRLLVINQISVRDLSSVDQPSPIGNQALYQVYMCVRVFVPRPARPLLRPPSQGWGGACALKQKQASVCQG